MKVFTRLSLVTVMLFLLTGFYVKAQNTITGTIFDDQDQESHIGATILVKGTTVGAVTDLSDQYAIQASPDDVLVFSCTGQEQEVAVAKQTIIAAPLSSSNLLNEVIAVAYRTAKKGSFTGSATQINLTFTIGTMSDVLSERIHFS